MTEELEVGLIVILILEITEYSSKQISIQMMINFDTRRTLSQIHQLIESKVISLDL